MSRFTLEQLSPAAAEYLRELRASSVDEISKNHHLDSPRDVDPRVLARNNEQYLKHLRGAPL